MNLVEYKKRIKPPVLVILKYFKIIIKIKYWPVYFRNAFRKSNKAFSDNEHLSHTIDWILKAQSISDSGGISAGYSLINGWRGDYPEVTGYIICTLIDYVKYSGDDSVLKNAIDAGDWEIEIQLPTGAVRGGYGINDYPIVFNTGQVILGWISLYEYTKEKKYIEAAKRAGDWLISVQDEDGKWSRFSHGSAYTFHSRVAWPLLRIYQQTEEVKYYQSAEKNISWIMSCVNKSGYFEHMSFSSSTQPYTHLIAYTLRGLLEASFILKNEDLKHSILKKVRIAADHIMESELSVGNLGKDYLPGTFDQNWFSTDRYSCLTGNAQMAIVYLKLSAMFKDERYFKIADRLIEGVKKTQWLQNKNNDICGAVSGSEPIWGEYDAHFFPSWAAKFFADALIYKLKILNDKPK